MDRIKKYIETFKEYVSLYDCNNDKIKLKYNHSLRVMELSNKYAKLLNFSEEDIELATLIGLLHDIGRFEQIQVYDSFDDIHTIDHADYSVEQLFNKGVIKRFTNKAEWYPIIEYAIKYHNKLEIPNIKDEKILMHTKLIRDTDKVDIMKAVIGRVKTDNSRVNQEIKMALKSHKLSNRKDTITKNDCIANQYGFVFDINYNIVLKEYKENFIKFHKSLEYNDELEEIYNEALKYINERIDKYDRNGNEV